MLELRARKSRGAAFVLDVAFSVPAGRTLVLAGESGSGKSTVLRLLAGLEQPDEGRIEVAGEVWYDGEQRRQRPPDQREVGWLPQDYALFPHLSVRENLAFGPRARGVARATVMRQVAAALERFGLGSLADRRPAQLSGGQQQRVALGRALIMEPRLLLLDEPLAALDLQTRRVLRRELRLLLAEFAGVTIFVTHSPVEAMVFGDQVAVLEQGRAVQVADRDELLRRPRSAYVAEFMGLNLLRGRVASAGPDGISRVVTPDGGVLIAAHTSPPGTDLFVAVSPREVTLHRQRPAGSAQNVYQGRVAEIVPEPPFGERVRVVLETTPRLVAEVTPAAIQQLALCEGTEVFASFKATGAVTYE